MSANGVIPYKDKILRLFKVDGAFVRFNHVVGTATEAAAGVRAIRSERP